MRLLGYIATSWKAYGGKFPTNARSHSTNPGIAITSFFIMNIWGTDECVPGDAFVIDFVSVPFHLSIAPRSRNVLDDAPKVYWWARNLA